MAQQTLNIGTTADDGTGDTIRAGGDKINDNFTELYDFEAVRFNSVAEVIADTNLGYATGVIVVAGDCVSTANGYAYVVAPSSATDYHIETAGGVKLYAEPAPGRIYTSEQFGWANAEDVTTAINRIWSRFVAGDTLLMQHFVTVSSLFAGNTLPAQFKLKALKPKVDGFNWTLDGSDTDFGETGMFSVENDGAEFHGIRFETDNANDVNGQYIRSPGDAAKSHLKIHDCYFGASSHVSGTAGIDAPIYLQNLDDVEFLRNEMLGGKWLFTAVGVDDVEWAYNQVSNSATDFGNAGGECIKTLQNDTWGVCERWHIHNNLADGMQRDFIDLTGGCSHWHIHHNHLKDIAGGGGGIDIKTQHPSREDTWNPNRDMIIEHNIFENASVIIKHNYDGTWLTSDVFNGTDAEVDGLDVRNILFRGNQWFGNGDLTNEGGRNVTVDGDHFYDDTNPFDWMDDVYDSFGNYVPSMRGMIIKNIVYHHTVADGSADMPPAKNIRIHFAHLRFENGSGGSGFQVRSGAEDWFISADKVTYEGTDTTNRMAFYVNQEVKNIHFHNINATHEGRGTETPYFINVQGVDADSDGSNIDGDIHVRDCNVRGFRGVLRVAQTDVDRMTIRDCVALDCTEGLVILSGGGNVSDVGNLYVKDNVGDGTIPEVSGTLNSGTVTESDNLGFT